MDPALRRRLLIVAGILIIVAVLAAVVGTQPGSRLRTQWELARIRSVEQTAVVLLDPGAKLTGEATAGWSVPALRPTEPVWRHRLVRLTLVPGCEIALPSGEVRIVDEAADSTSGASFVRAAQAALTVHAAVTDQGQELVCRRVVIGTPAYAGIRGQLRAGAASAKAPAEATNRVSGQASFQRSDGSDVLVLAIPSKQEGNSFSGMERQYALLQPETLYLAQTDAGVRPVTLAAFKELVADNPDEQVEADLEERSAAGADVGVFVVQLRVRVPGR